MLSAARATTLPASVLHRITENPTLLSHASSSALNMTAAERADILAGYIHGFRMMFILNASLAATAAIVAYYMIEHKELIREDDAERRREAAVREETERRPKGVDKGSVTQFDKRFVTEMEMETGLGKGPGRGLWEGEIGKRTGKRFESGSVLQIERVERETKRDTGKGVDRGFEKGMEKGSAVHIERVERGRGKGREKEVERRDEKQMEMGNVLHIERVERQHTVRRSPLDGS